MQCRQTHCAIFGKKFGKEKASTIVADTGMSVEYLLYGESLGQL